jgi:hypothetical protein
MTGALAKTHTGRAPFLQGPAKTALIGFIGEFDFEKQDRKKGSRL